MDGVAWWAVVHGVARSQTLLSNFTFTFHFHAFEKEVATHSSVLAWRIPGTGSLVGCRLWGRTESDTTAATQRQQQQQQHSDLAPHTLLSQRQEFLNEDRHPAGAWHAASGEAAGDNSSMETFTMAAVWLCGFSSGQELSRSRICGFWAMKGQGLLGDPCKPPWRFHPENPH